MLDGIGEAVFALFVGAIIVAAIGGAVLMRGCEYISDHYDVEIRRVGEVVR